MTNVVAILTEYKHGGFQGHFTTQSENLTENEANEGGRERWILDKVIQITRSAYPELLSQMSKKFPSFGQAKMNWAKRRAIQGAF